MVVLVGNVDPQTGVVERYLRWSGAWGDVQRVTSPADLRPVVEYFRPHLIVVAGWRHLIPPDVLRMAPVIGFHSAKLPEYPGRAPVPWTLLRGDRYAYNTMFFLDEGIDSGDIIDERYRRIRPGDTPASLYEWMAWSAVNMLQENLPFWPLPRTPQDLSKRGPLTTKDGWDRWFERERLATGHA